MNYWSKSNLNNFDAKIQLQEVCIFTDYLLPNQGDIDLKFLYLEQRERERANRFHYEKHRTQFIQGRYLLKSIIANYMGISISEVKFQYN